MKKQLLIAALGFMSVGASAQMLEEKPILTDLNNYLGTIPSCFVKDAKPYLVLEAIEPYNNDVNNNGKYDSYYYIYDENLSLVKEITSENKIGIAYYLECGQAFDGDGMYFSQTLFNDDDAFEYIEYDRNEGEPNEYGYGDPYSTYFRIVSDNGKELARVTFDKPVIAGFEFHVIRLGNKVYLNVESFQSNCASYRKFFLINKSANGESAIREVEAPEALQAFPSLARKNQRVSIELGKHAGDRLQLTAANGSVVRQVPVKAGQKSVQLSTRGLSSGLYVVSTVGKNGAQENCKLVIK